MRQEIERFDAAAEDGTVFKIIKYQNYKKYSPVSSSSKNLPTSTELLTTDGSFVNEINDTTFEIVEMDLIVRKI